MAGCQWDSTPHASTTTVSAAQVVYDAANVKTAGTLAFWIKSPFALDGTYTGFGYNDWVKLDFGVSDSIDGIEFRFGISGDAILRIIENSTTHTYNQIITANTWYHIALLWSETAGTYNMIVNGASVLSGTFSGFANSPVSLYLMDAISNKGAFEISDLIVTDYAMSAADIAAIYNAGVSLSAARIQRGIDARCTGASAKRQADNINHVDMTLDFTTIGRAWRGEVRQIASDTFSASGSFTLTNAGNVTCKNLVVRIIASGAATVTLAVGGFTMTVSSTAANDELVIDCAGRTVRKNGTDDYANVSFGGANTTADWLPLAVGDNTLAVTLTGAEVEIIAQWYDTYR